MDANTRGYRQTARVLGFKQQVRRGAPSRPEDPYSPRWSPEKLEQPFHEPNQIGDDESTVVETSEEDERSENHDVFELSDEDRSTAVETSDEDERREDYDDQRAEGNFRAWLRSFRSFDGHSSSRDVDWSESTVSSAGAIGRIAPRENVTTAMTWLSSIEHNRHQERTLRGHCPGTGQTFLSSNGVQNWLNGEKQTLFCPGLPGAGKTMAASLVIDHLQHQFAKANVGIAYLYGRAYGYTYNVHDILRSLLKQLALCRPTVPDAIRSLYRHQQRRGTVPRLEKIFKVLDSVVGLFSRVFIVADALDELPLSDPELELILSEITLWRSRYNVNLLVTSRPVPFITRYFNDVPTVEIRADQEDVKRYLGWRLKTFPLRVKPPLQRKIISEISSAADGMFLLAVRSMDTLAESRSPKAIPAVLEALPMSVALDRYYRDILRQIVNKTVKGKPSGKLALSLLVCSQRRLTSTEIQHAVAMDTVGPRFDPASDSDNLPEVDDMLSACLGLLTIDPKTCMLDFTHQTAAEYFKRKCTRDASYAHLRITRLCINYLSLQEFAGGACSTDEEYERRLARYPFYEYSAKNWGFHAQHRYRGEPPGLNLLVDFARVSMCLQGIFAEPGTVGYSQRYPRATGMHVAAHFGLDYLYSDLIVEGQQVQVKDSNGHAPLWWALERRQHRMVKILKDKDNITLRQLIKVGRRDMIKRLLDAGYDVNSLDFFRRTPLHSTISSGAKDLLVDFVEAGAKVNIRDGDGATPLRLAVQLYQHHLIDILLGYGASPEDICLSEWRRLYRRQRSDVAVLAAKDNKGLSLHFIAPKEDFAMETHGSGHKRHYILHGSCIPWYSIFTIPKVSPAQFELATHISRHEDETEFQYALFSYMPNRHKPAGPNENHDQIGISWKVRWQTDEESAEYWQSTDYYSTLPYVWMPSGGIDLLLHFLRYLNQKWVELTESEKKSLETFRRNVFRGKGESRDLLDELLQNTDACNYLRITLQEHALKVKEFGNEYCRRHEGDDAMTQVHEATDCLFRDVSQRIDSLDKACQDLIQIEFNLVSINEARLSTSTTMSMKRLSWITFVFLPATFTSTVFGMNINLLENNPSWWWYLPFLGVVMALTLVGWLLFKHNPNIEVYIDRRIETVVGRGRLKKRNQGNV